MEVNTLEYTTALPTVEMVGPATQSHGMMPAADVSSNMESPSGQEPTTIPDEDEPLVLRIEAFIKRFVFLRDDPLYQLIALWVIGTHVHEEFDFYGYLFLHSPEPQTGKSRLLEVLSLLVKNPTDLLVSPTEAVLFRTAKGSTQLLDEVDTWANEDQLRAVLNAGFKKAGSVARTQQSQDGGYQVIAYRVFCPRALAGIGPHILSKATKDRTFTIRMDRQKKEERRERFRANAAAADAGDLRDAISRWVRENKKQLSESYQAGDFGFLDDCSDRTIDIATPLAAILELIYPTSASRQTATRRLLDAISKTRNEAIASNDPLLFRELLRVAKIDGQLIGSAGELAEVCDLTGVVNEQEIGTALRRYGFEPKSVRRPGESPKYRYSLTPDALSDIVERYGGPGIESPPEPRLHEEN